MIKIDGYPYDMASSEDHEYENEVSDYPVETGSDQTDHIRARPVMVTITDAVKSDTPLGPKPEGKPSAEALARLLALHESRRPVQVQTSLRTYENMALQALSIPRDATTGRALWFTATFKQLRLITNERTTVPTSIPNARGKKNAGWRSSPGFFGDGGTFDASNGLADATKAKNKNRIIIDQVPAEFDLSENFEPGPGAKGIGRIGGAGGSF